jgi:hypothetical protein
MSQTSDARLAGIDQGVAALQSAMALIASELRIHGECLQRILETITPEEAGESGPPLHELLGHLIARLDSQSIMLKDILAAQTALARNLPLDVVRVIDDNLGGAGQSAAGAADGKVNGHSAQP